jgi:hypothetical protein
MKTRKLQNGKEVVELDHPITLKVYTKCPEKWILVDKETGEMYTGFSSEGSLNWKKLGIGDTSNFKEE